MKNFWKSCPAGSSRGLDGAWWHTCARRRNMCLQRERLTRPKQSNHLFLLPILIDICKHIYTCLPAKVFVNPLGLIANPTKYCLMWGGRNWLNGPNNWFYASCKPII
jgi:hypothetical protein